MLEDQINKIIINALETVKSEVLKTQRDMEEKHRQLKISMKSDINDVKVLLEEYTYPGMVYNIDSNGFHITKFSVSFGKKEVCYNGGYVKLDLDSGDKFFIQVNEFGDIVIKDSYAIGCHRIGIIVKKPDGKPVFMKNVGVYSGDREEPRLVEIKALTKDLSSYSFRYEDGKVLVLRKKDEEGNFDIIDNGEIVSKIYLDI